MIFREAWINRPISVIMVFMVVCIFGFIAFIKLPVSLMPEQKTPWISVIVELPGMTPDKIETILTKPLEEKIAVLPGVERFISVSEEGKCRINVRFVREKDSDIAVLELRECVEMARVTFPRETQEPLVLRYDPSESPVIILALDLPGRDINALRTLAENKIKPRFQRLDGVSEVFVSGGAEQEIHVDVDRDRLFARKLDIQDVFREIQFANVELAPGHIADGIRQFPLSAAWKFTNIREIGETSVTKEGGTTMIRVRDIATVSRSDREKDSISHIDRKERVSIYIQKAGTANLMRLAHAIKTESKKIQKDIPGLQIDIVYDQSNPVRRALGQSAGSAIWGMLMAVFVLFLFFRRLSFTVIVGCAVPVSIIASFIFFYFKGMSLNVLSLSGLAIACGMLVDNSIVVLESIVINGSVIQGTSRVEKAVVASTLTTVAVFLPIVFLSKENAILYGDISLAIILTVLGSMFVSLILLPVLFTKIPNADTLPGGGLPLTGTPQISPQRGILLKKMRGWLTVFWNKIQKKQQPLMGKIQRLIGFKNLREALAFSLEHHRFVLTIAVLFIAISFSLLPFLKQEYIDPLEGATANVTVELPSGMDLEQTGIKTTEVEQCIQDGFKKNIRRMTTRIEKAHAVIVIELDPHSRMKTSAFIKRGKKLTAGIQGCDIIFSEPSGDNAAGEQRTIELSFTGPEISRLQELCRDAARQFRTIPEIKDIIFHFKEPQTEILAVVDRERAAVFGLNAMKIATMLREMIHGPVTAKFFENDKQTDIRVMLNKAGLINDLDVKGLFLRNDTGTLVPLRSVCDIRMEKSGGKIYRLNKQRSVSMSVRYEGSDLNRMIKRVKTRIDRMVFPRDYAYEFGENYQLLKKNRIEMLFAILLSIVLVYMIMAAVLEDLFSPLLILVSIPLALAAVFLVLFLTGSSLNLSVYIGLVMLAGIVVNNGILLIDAIKQKGAIKEKEKKIQRGDVLQRSIPMYSRLRRNPREHFARVGRSPLGHVPSQKIDLQTTVIEATQSRLRPILMTTITTVAGLLPILLSGGEGSALWRPLALTMITGLSASTVLTLFVVPAMWYGVNNK